MSREGQRRAAHARARPARAGFDYPPTDGASAIGKPHEASRKKNDCLFQVVAQTAHAQPENSGGADATLSQAPPFQHLSADLVREHVDHSDLSLKGDVKLELVLQILP